jgi:hypothetical protein
MPTVPKISRKRKKGARPLYGSSAVIPPQRQARLPEAIHPPLHEGNMDWEEAARRKKDMDTRFTLVDRWRVAKAGVRWHRCRFERNLEPLLVEMEEHRTETNTPPAPLRKAIGLPSLEMAAARVIKKLAGRHAAGRDFSVRRVLCGRISEYRKNIANAQQFGWISEDEATALTDGLDDILIAIGEISSEAPGVPANYQV